MVLRRPGTCISGRVHYFLEEKQRQKYRDLRFMLEESLEKDRHTRLGPGALMVVKRTWYIHYTYMYTVPITVMVNLND